MQYKIKSHGFNLDDPQAVEDTVVDEYSGSLLFHRFEKFQKFYEHVDEERKERIHLMSVIGGFYCLNLLPLFKPMKITLYDKDPFKIVFATLILRALKMSESREEFLERLLKQDYPSESRWEETMRRNIALRERGEQFAWRRARKGLRLSFSHAWEYALKNFTAVKNILAFAPVYLRVEDIRDESFRTCVRKEKNVWLYTSNIFTFMDVKLEFQHPENAVIFALYYHDEDFLDLANYSEPVVVENKEQKFKIAIQ